MLKQCCLSIGSGNPAGTSILEVCMKTYDELEKVAGNFLRTINSLESVNRELDSLESKPDTDPGVISIISRPLQHNDVMIDVRDVAYKKKRIGMYERRAREMREAVQNYLRWFSKSLIPNHWYVFNGFAMINVFWVNPDGQYMWRVDYEMFDDYLNIRTIEEYIEYNAHNMEVLECFGDNRPIGLIEWYLNYAEANK